MGPRPPSAGHGQRWTWLAWALFWLPSSRPSQRNPVHCFAGFTSQVACAGCDGAGTSEPADNSATRPRPDACSGARWELGGRPYGIDLASGLASRFELLLKCEEVAHNTAASGEHLTASGAY
jgi:hypothetical protein